MARRFPWKQSVAGFTLLELLVVMVMISILAAIAAPSWLALVNRQRAAAARDDVLQVLRTAQSDAKTTGLPRTVTITPSNTPPTIQYEGNPRPIGQEAGIGENQITVNAYQNSPAASVDPINITFDRHGAVDLAAGQNLPFSIVAGISGSGTRRCAVVQTIIGTIRQADESDSDCPAPP